MVNPLENAFPRLETGAYRVTSPANRFYNCVSWAAGDDTKWWWPTPVVKEVHWPTSAERNETLSAFRAVFASLGYRVCDSADAEPNMEKIAIFAADTPTHVARQHSNGRWTSKLGELEDIEHDLDDLEGDVYGRVVLFMQRPASQTSAVD
jgi:hypothetical protein